jgi:hypothetical protein
MRTPKQSFSLKFSTVYDKRKNTKQKEGISPSLALLPGKITTCRGARQRNIIVWTEGQGKSKRGKRLNDQNTESISNTEIEKGECSISVLSHGEEWRKGASNSTGWADKEPITRGRNW